MKALYKNNKKISKILMENGANVNISSNSGETALIYATKNNLEDIIQYLILKGAKVNIKSKGRGFFNDFGETPLILAVKKNLKDIVKLYIENGANVNETDLIGNTALMYSEDKGISEVLIKAGANLNVKNIYGYSALSLSARRDRIELVKLLIASGADKNVKDIDGKGILELNVSEKMKEYFRESK